MYHAMCLFTPYLSMGTRFRLPTEGWLWLRLPSFTSTQHDPTVISFESIPARDRQTEERPPKAMPRSSIAERDKGTKLPGTGSESSPYLGSLPFD